MAKRPDARSCRLCGRYLPQLAFFCETCLQRFVSLPQPRCARCQASLLPNGRCPDCPPDGFPFDQVMAIGAYAGLLREAIYRLKFSGDRNVADPLGRWLAACVGRQRRAFDVITWAPIPAQHLMQRGYNQAEVLACNLARYLWLPPVSLLNREDAYLPHALSSRKQRRKPLLIAATRRLKQRHVLLVDDVLTTGATAAGCAQALLLDAGAARVSVAVIARA
ncbi:MAG: ComF family protein [Firmicutes bacterium]|nr:ComF family protein [Bacillota bacterium]